jgi:F-type H+-transporting ATPase subunit delta
VASESGELDRWLSELTELARIMQMPSARTVFASPAVPSEQKQAAIEHLLPNASPLLRNFLSILAIRDRLREVPDIAEAFRELINEQRGVVEAEVTTAVPLDAELERVVAQRLATYLERRPDQVTLKSKVDPSIIGGVVARVGDRVIDDSIRGRLDRLRRALVSTG